MVPEERILIVDDEQNMLDGLKRSVGRSFNIVTAPGGTAGLDALRSQGPFAVVINDMQMPDVNGLTFLREAQRISPHSVFMMLTGNSDQKTAVDAVNQGRVFRFLNKPCPREQIEGAINGAIERFRLLRAEQILLEKTLAGSVQALLQVLQLTRPRLFHRSTGLHKLAGWLARASNDPQPWQVQMAAALASIGCVALTDELVDAALTGEPLSDDDRAEFHRHAQIGADLLSSIPRMERTAAIIRGQFDAPVSPEAQPGDDGPVASGIPILRAAQALDEQLYRRKSWAVAVHETSAQPWILPWLQKILQGTSPDWITNPQKGKIRTATIGELRPGMILQQDVKTDRGDLLIANGHEVTEIIAERLHNFAKLGRIAKTVMVLDSALTDTPTSIAQDLAWPTAICDKSAVAVRAN
jgi:ActR/RegA family two-component response regulator